MKVVVFGSSGMVGQGLMRECAAADDVTEVISIVRTASTSPGAKVKELVPADLYDLSPHKAELRGVDAVLFCLGVSAAGMSEEAYRHITYDLTLASARTIHEVSPHATFIYVSGQGTDSTEKKGAMWARVKGKTENDLLALFDKAYMFRPGLIRPRHGIVSKTRVYRITYAILWPILPLLEALIPRGITNTERVGKAMLIVARKGAANRLVTNGDIHDLTS